MATAEWLAENRQVIGYIPKNIHALLQKFKVERGFKSCSQALIAILSDYFGQTDKPRPEPNREGGEDRISPLEQRMEVVERTLTQLVEVITQSERVNTLLEQESNDFIPLPPPTPTPGIGLDQVEAPAPPQLVMAEILRPLQAEPTLNLKDFEVKPQNLPIPFSEKGSDKLDQPRAEVPALPAARSADPLQGIDADLGINFQATYLQTIADLANQRAQIIPQSASYTGDIQKGLELLRIGNYSSAVEVFTQAIQIMPQGINDVSQSHNLSVQREFLYCCRGLALCRLNLADAMKDFSNAVKLNSKSSIALFYRGVICMKLGNLGEARRNYSIARSIGVQIADRCLDAAQSKLDKRTDRT